MGWRRRTGHDRAVEQWRRELDRLDDPDAARELWAAPQQHRLEPAPEPPRPRRVRRSRGPLLPGLAVVVGLLVFVGLSNPGSSTYWVKEMVRRAQGEASTSYAFMSVSTATGQPVAWDRCQPIRYRVNPAGAPEGWALLVDAAVGEVREAGDFVLQDAGVTDETNYLGRRAGEPVLIGWGPASTYPSLAGDVAGFGGASSLNVDGRSRFVTGQVLLDSEDYAVMAADGRDTAMREILVHELLHVLGLDHVEDPNQLMFPSYGGQRLSAGDREGLARLASVPCG